MTGANIPKVLEDLVFVRGVGCTGVTLRAVTEMEKVADDVDLVNDCMAFLRRELNGYATLWHLERALQQQAPRVALPRFATRLRTDVRRSLDTASRYLRCRAGGFVAAPSSGITRQLMARLAESPAGASDAPATGLSGADAIGPTEVLNIVGTRDLATRVPTFIVTTGDRLVPGPVFDSLGSALFERVPLAMFEAVVVNDEVLSPAEVGRRAEHAGGQRPQTHHAGVRLG